ncbi:TetR/AcrR family transcriptional regulator [Massilia genomosp. 1]|uniref:TetR family transcriptional regulator n=1 Tax=Massilia genomosp. 1 TaxID=2609280 RepID=A0ABX0MR00_9BURK|nr:TetR/AcrR family transcriptional regulator [Massilia genomosp. 1]NHZ65183.1 TetR family transcriptional regulator [Massilia genomosp. 1]
MAGRPREFDRDLALVKARDAFWERGYEGVSMADLVQVMGIASARIYAAFGSKENLFREAIALYEADEGGFAERALAGPAPARAAIETMLRDAVLAYTRAGAPQGCMVVSAATNYSSGNDAINAWLAGHRRARTDSIIERLRRAAQEGELKADADVAALGDCYAVLLHGISVQARDGIGGARLLAMIAPAMRALDDALAE